MPFSAYSEQHTIDQVLGLVAGTVNSAIAAGTAGVTSITTTALTEAVSNGDVILVSWGTSNVEAFTASANAGVSATSISVTSQTSNKAHAVGDAVVRFPRFVAPLNVYAGLIQQSGTTNQSITAGTAYTSLTVNALPQALSSGDVLFVGQLGEQVTLSAGAALNATSISINSWTAANTYSSGVAITRINTPTEPSGSAYARVAVANNLTNWPSSTGSEPATKQNGTAVTFPQATGSWGTIAAVGFWDASSSGNLILTAPVGTVQVVNNGGTPSFATNALTITIK